MLIHYQKLLLCDCYAHDNKEFKLLGAAGGANKVNDQAEFSKSDILHHWNSLISLHFSCMSCRGRYFLTNTTHGLHLILKYDHCSFFQHHGHSARIQFCYIRLVVFIFPSYCTLTNTTPDPFPPPCISSLDRDRSAAML